MQVNLDTSGITPPPTPPAAPATPPPAAPATPPPAADGLALNQPPATPPVPPAPPAPPQPPAAPAKIDFAAAKLEMLTTGQLSEATLAAYEARGISRDDLAVLTQPVGDTAKSIQAEVFDAAGGSNAYQELKTWAEANLAPDAQMMFNANITSGNRDLALAAVSTLKSQYERMMGTPPTRFVMGGSAVPTLGGYASRAEMVADMSKSEYRTDEAFRAQVKRRLALTTVF